MELGAGAGRLGHDRVGGGLEPLHVADAGDLDRDVLAPRVEDLLAEQPVARVGTDALRGHVVGGQRRQDPDHHQVRADLGRLGLRAVEVAAQQLLELLEPTLAQLDRWHVDLDVEQAQLGLEGGVGDGGERLGALQRRVAALVDQVELDLEPGHRVVGVEPRLAQHAGEHVEAAPDLLAVAGPVGPGELLCLHLFAHVGTLGPISGVRGGPRVRGAGEDVVNDALQGTGALVGRPLTGRPRGSQHAIHAALHALRCHRWPSSRAETSSTSRDEHLPGGPQDVCDRVEQLVGQPVAGRPPARGPELLRPPDRVGPRASRRPRSPPVPGPER